MPLCGVKHLWLVKDNLDGSDFLLNVFTERWALLTAGLHDFKRELDDLLYAGAWYWAL